MKRLIGFSAVIMAANLHAEPIMDKTVNTHSSSNGGIMIFQGSSSDVNITSASIVYFGGNKNGHFCNNPHYATHQMYGRYHFSLDSGLFIYELHATPIYNSFHPKDQIDISAVHCIEYVVQNADHSFSPQLVSFEVNCTNGSECLANSPAEVITVS